MRVLASLTNVGAFNSQFSLAVVDTDSGRVDLVDCSEFLKPGSDSGITGLCALPDGRLAVAVQGSKPKIVFLDDHWRPLKIVQDARFADIHSISHRDGFLFVTSTGQNKILKVSLSTYVVSLFWEYRLDTPFLHINELVFVGNRPLVSSHKFPPEVAGEPLLGGCWHPDTYELVMPDMRQPHSLTIEGEDIYCLSSNDSRVVRIRDGELQSFTVDGYLRGLKFVDGKVLIGSSSKRLISRKKDGFFKYAEFRNVIGNPIYMSSLVITDRDFQVLGRVDTTLAGFEIYDVMADPGVPERLFAPAPAASRMQTMQRQYYALRERMDELNAKAGAA